MNAHIKYEGEDNVIYTVHWTYTATSDLKEPGTDIPYSAQSIGTESYTYVKGDPFVPYADTEAFENVVIGWLDSSIDVDTMKKSLDEVIDLEINPVNEDLYFTWNNPTPPTPPPSEEDSEE